MSAAPILAFPGSSGRPFSAAVQQGGDSIAYPIQPDQLLARVVTAEFLQETASYRRPAPNSTRPGDPTLIFCADSPLRYRDADLSTFTRTWANIPLGWTETAPVTYTYPAILAHRWSNTHTTTSIVFHQYILTGPGTRYTLPCLIPCSPAFNPIYGLDDNGNTATYLSANSVPTAIQWLNLVLRDQNLPGSFSIQTEDATLHRYQGNIWELRTPFVKARGR